MTVSHALQPMLVRRKVCHQLQVRLISCVPKDSGASQVLRQDGQSLSVLVTTVHVQPDIIAKKELKTQ